MNPHSSPYAPRLVLCALLSLFAFVTVDARPPLDFTGIWRLDEQASDSQEVILARVSAERHRENPPLSGTAHASSSGSPPPADGTGTGHAAKGGMGRGGYGGMGAHGHGHRGHPAQHHADDSRPEAPSPPPLLDVDSVLNVQQDASTLRLSLDNEERLEAPLDDTARQSLNGTAIVHGQRSSDGLLISMRFSDDTVLDQHWRLSPDGKRLTDIEQWHNPDLGRPIVFRRVYDRLDL